MNNDQHIEIIGYSCRLPGAETIESLWDVLRLGQCTTSTIPESRWSSLRYKNLRVGEKGKSYTFAAGVLNAPFDFDPAVFGLSPREAEQMDPQQRLMLEVVWEAIEMAGISPSQIAGSHTGVFVGASGLDYSNRYMHDTGVSDAYFMTGNTLSIISNRISYIFDLRGPSFTIDTACSSSLVALCQAVEGLQLGKIDTAIVGGVNLLLTPYPFVGFSAATMLSPRGQCRAFDADANGYVRSEGAVALILRRSEKAAANEDRSFGRIVLAGMNSDGRTNGISLPSSNRQASLLHEVYDRAEIDINDLAFVEAHGTGTRVGDFAEAEALGSVLGSKRSGKLLIGSVKTNIGHLEPASGLAGVLKACLALEHDYLPASLHFDVPNPEISFDTLNLQVASQGVSLSSEKNKPRFAGVSSFGFGGTNAHVILRDPASGRSSEPKFVPGAGGVMLLSSKCHLALRDTAAQFASELKQTNDNLKDPAELAAQIVHQRDLMDHRVCILGQDREELADGLAAYLADTKSAKVITGHSPDPDRAVAFAYSGNGAQWAGMGRLAYEHNSVFKQRFDDSSHFFESLAGWSLCEALKADDLEQRITSTLTAQPLLFACQAALSASMKALGVRPAAVFGHSVGEVAAAEACGALSLQDAITVIYKRSIHQEQFKGQGLMAAVLASSDDVKTAIKESGFEHIQLAAVNSFRSVTISGPAEDIRAFIAYARKNKIAGRIIQLDYPFHSNLIDPIKIPLLEDLSTLSPRKTDIPFISTTTGEVVSGDRLDGRHWWENVRQPVRFSDAVNQAQKLGCRVFLEMGPRPVLTTYLKDSLGEGISQTTILKTLDAKDKEGIDPVLASFARLLAHGGKVNIASVFGESPRRNNLLPHYPWQKTTYRISHTVENSSSLWPDSRIHPLLGWPDNEGRTIWHMHLDPVSSPWLRDHKVNGQIVVPGTALAEIALAAARDWLKTLRLEIRDMDIVQALMLDEKAVMDVQMTLSPDSSSFQLSSRRRLSRDEWQVHATGRFAVIPSRECKLDELDLTSFRSMARDEVDERVYRLAALYGLDYGPAFRKISSVQRVSETGLKLSLTGSTESVFVHEERYCLFPNEFDACFHGLTSLYDEVSASGGVKQAYIPVRFGRLRLYQAATHIHYAEVQISSASARSIAADFILYDADGAPVAALEDARFRAASLKRHVAFESIAYHCSARKVVQPADGSEALKFSSVPLQELDQTPDEAVLLLEAGARRSAHDAIMDLTRGSGTVLADSSDEEDVDPFVLTYRNGLLVGLEGAGLARLEDEVWKLTEDSGLPEMDSIIKTVISEYPSESAACVLLSRAHRLLPSILSGNFSVGDAPLYGSPTIEHYLSTASSRQGMVRAISAYVHEFVDHWQYQRPICILELGPGSGELSFLFQPLVRSGKVILQIADTDKTRLDLIRSKIKNQNSINFIHLSGDGAALADAGVVDLAVSAGGLSQLSDCDNILSQVRAVFSPGGQLLGAEIKPDLWHDLVFGLMPGWYARSVDPSFPLGSLRYSEEWHNSCEAAGYGSFELKQNDRICLFRAVADNVGKQVAIAQSDEPAVLIISGSEKEACIGEAITLLFQQEGRDFSLISPQTHSECFEHFSPKSKACWEDVLSQNAANERRPTNVFYLHGAFGGKSSEVEALKARISTLRSLLLAAKQNTVRIWIIAPGGAPVEVFDGAINPVQCGIWGFVRVAVNEYSDCDIRLIDIDAGLSNQEIASSLVKLLTIPGEETELILGREHLHVLRVARGAPEDTLLAGRGFKAKLDFDLPGSLDNLRWQAEPRFSPETGQIEIEVAAASLNFRDVMWAMGLLPDEALEGGYSGPSLGLECSGRVSALGEGVSGFAIGDQVIAFASSCFSSHVIVDDIAVAHLPDEIDLVAGATIPVAFFTAFYALHHLARLGQDEWVLIHGGAGGVGLAAMQIAKWRGARIIATAGSEEKRAFLSALGVDHVLDSRTLDFVDDVMKLTGDGVDVVLNSLSGEAMERSLELVRPFGRFLELGKRDYYANTKLGLRPFRRNVSYFGIDADQLLSQQAKLGRRLFSEMVQCFRDGMFSALPYRVFKADQTIAAFRLMQQAGHVGKIVITPPKPSEIPAKKPVKSFKADPHGAHVIIGGLGGFGFETARWLARCGARHIVLTSRSGVVSQDIQEPLKQLLASGVAIEVVSSDVSDYDSLAGCLESIRSQRPIKGIIHAAMVLQDAMIPNLTQESIETVLMPKVQGAINLDQLTTFDALDYFILFSSVTTLIGNPGQANYVSANAYMEGLARQRRAAGKPGLAIGWGAITDAGFLTRNEDISTQLTQRGGFGEFRAEKALMMLERLLGNDNLNQTGASVAVAPMDWRVTGQHLALFSKPLFFDIADETDTSGSAAEDQVDLAKLVSGLDEEQARLKVAYQLALEVARILRIPADEINLQRSLTDIGMDSLMGLELRSEARERFGIDIPLVAISEGVSLRDIADKVLKQLRGEDADDDRLLSRHVPGSLDEAAREKVIETLKEKSSKMGNILS